MYNRYIPQADGSYRRNRIDDPVPPPRPTPMPEQGAASDLNVREPPCRKGQSCPQGNGNCFPPAVALRPRKKTQTTSAGNFLKQLLPKNFDTEDLLIVLLLLLMAGDCQEDQNTALLTLALYLFL